MVTVHPIKSAYDPHLPRPLSLVQILHIASLFEINNFTHYSSPGTFISSSGAVFFFFFLFFLQAGPEPVKKSMFKLITLV